MKPLVVVLTIDRKYISGNALIFNCETIFTLTTRYTIHVQIETLLTVCEGQYGTI